jgi:hypothetical protein
MGGLRHYSMESEATNQAILEWEVMGREGAFVDEMFVDIPAFPNYVISNYGRVINTESNYELKLTTDPNGYLRAVLYRDGKRFEFGVHRLVARAFFLNWRPGVEVYHKDGNKLDCSVLNLTLGTLKVRGGATDPWAGSDEE